MTPLSNPTGLLAGALASFPHGNRYRPELIRFLREHWIDIDLVETGAVFAGSFCSAQDTVAAIFSDKNETRAPTNEQLGWLLGEGVPLEALARPFAIAVGSVIFVDAGRYVPSPLGQDAVIVPVIDNGIVDAAAWQPRTGEIATRLGVGACLGQGQIGRDGLGTYGEALPVFRTPLGWLKANRCGIVIVDPTLTGYLVAGMTLRAEDAEHKALLDRTLRVAAPTVVLSAVPSDDE